MNITPRTQPTPSDLDASAPSATPSIEPISYPSDAPPHSMWVYVVSAETGKATEMEIHIQEGSAQKMRKVRISVRGQVEEHVFEMRRMRETWVEYLGALLLALGKPSVCPFDIAMPGHWRRAELSLPDIEDPMGDRAICITIDAQSWKGGLMRTKGGASSKDFVVTRWGRDKAVGNTLVEAFVTLVLGEHNVYEWLIDADVWTEEDA